MHWGGWEFKRDRDRDSVYSCMCRYIYASVYVCTCILKPEVKRRVVQGKFVCMSAYGHTLESSHAHLCMQLHVDT